MLVIFSVVVRAEDTSGVNEGWLEGLTNGASWVVELDQAGVVDVHYERGFYVTTVAASACARVWLVFLNGIGHWSSIVEV